MKHINQAAKYGPCPLPETGFVRLPTVLHHIPVSRSTWWTMVKEGRAPQPCKLGPNMTAWRAEEIRELIASLSQADAA